MQTKENYYIALICVKLQRFLADGCKYEKNILYFTDEKLIAKVVNGDFTAIANKPKQVLKELINWNGDESDSGEGNSEGKNGERETIDCKDYQIQAIATRG